MGTFRADCEAKAKSLCALFGSWRSAILAGSLLVFSLVCSAASGCATTKMYHLNLDPTTYPATLAALANAAGEMGYQVTHLASAVNVRYDHDTWIYYSLGDHDYGMSIVVTNDVASNLQGARLDEAKAKGEEIWTKAMASRQRAARPAASSSTPPPSS